MARIQGVNPVKWLANGAFDLWARVFGFDVFISYARSDGIEIARRIRHQLSKRFLVFIDEEDIPLAESFPHRIRREIARVRILVVILTPQALKSKWVKQEVAEFRRTHSQETLRILPVFVPPVQCPIEDDDWSDICDFNGIVHRSDSGNPLVPYDGAPADQRPKVRDSTINGVERLHHGIRRRRVAAITIFLSFLVMTLAPSWGIWERSRERTRREALDSASVAESRLEWGLAAIALARARNAGADSREITARIESALERSIYLPMARATLPSSSHLIGIHDVEGKPWFAFSAPYDETAGGPWVGIWTDGAWRFVRRIPRGCDPTVSFSENAAFILAAKSIHRIPFARDATIKDAVIPGPADPDGDVFEMRIVAGRINILEHANPNDRLYVLENDLTNVTQVDVLRIDEAKTVSRLSRRDDRAVVIVEHSHASLNEALTVRWLDLEGHATPLVESRSIVARVPRRSLLGSLSLDDFELAPNDEQVFAAFQEFDFSGTASGPSPEPQWVAFDLRFPRTPWPMEVGVAKLEPTAVGGAVEAVYRTSSAQIRALTLIDFVVLDRPSKTLESKATVFEVLTEGGPRSAVRTAIVADDRLVLYDDLQAIMAVALNMSTARETTEPSSIIASSNGALVAVEQFGIDDGPRQLTIVAQPTLLPAPDSSAEKLVAEIQTWKTLQIAMPRR